MQPYSQPSLQVQEFGVVSYTLLLSLIEYKTLVLREDMEAAQQLLPSIPKVSKPQPYKHRPLQFCLPGIATGFSLAVSLGQRHRPAPTQILSYANMCCIVERLCQGHSLGSISRPGLAVQHVTNGLKHWIWHFGVVCRASWQYITSCLWYVLTTVTMVYSITVMLN